MRNPIWQDPQTAFDAADQLENLTSLIEFVTDMMGQGGPAITKEYSFGERGYHGLFLFLSFLEDEMEKCQEIIRKEVGR